MDAAEAAELVRAACLEAAEAAYEDAGIRGLCAEGRWEAAVGALQRLDVTALLRDARATRPLPTETGE
jgi:hypothetical protein